MCELVTHVFYYTMYLTVFHSRHHILQLDDDPCDDEKEDAEDVEIDQMQPKALPPPLKARPRRAAAADRG
jgi:hypothetical protein